MAAGSPDVIETATEGGRSPQEDAFLAICDVQTARLRLPIGHGPGREALLRLNAATHETFSELTAATCFTIGSTLSQGSCLLAAVLSMLGFLVPAWAGPPAALGKHAVHIMQPFIGKWGTKV